MYVYILAATTIEAPRGIYGMGRIDEILVYFALLDKILMCLAHSALIQPKTNSLSTQKV